MPYVNAIPKFQFKFYLRYNFGREEHQKVMSQNSQVVVTHAAVVAHKTYRPVAPGAEGVEAAALWTVEVVQNHRR